MMKNYSVTGASTRTEPKAGVAAEVCRITILYDDEPAKERAERVCHRLAWTLQGRTSLEFSGWKFDWLTHPVAAQKAAAAATDADIVIVAVAKSDLPAAARNWFQAWTAPRTRSDGVLALLAPGTSEWNIFDDELVGFLAGVAQRRGMDFLPGGAAGSYHLMNRIDLRAEVVTPVLHRILDRPIRGC